MKKIKNLVIGGIENKIINLVLVTIILMIIGYTAVIVYQSDKLTGLVKETNEKQQESISSLSTETMNNVITSSLGKTTALEAYIVDDLFEDVKSGVYMLHDYADTLYRHSREYPLKDVDRPDASKKGIVSVQLLAEEGVDISEPDLTEEIGLLGNLTDMMISLYESSDELGSCFIGTSSGVLLIADEIPDTKILDDGSVMDFPVTERDWFTGAAKEGGVYFSDIKTDAFTGNIGVTVSVPVYGTDGELLAVVGADVFLNDLSDAIAESEEYGGFVYIVNKHGHVIFSPEEQGLFKVEVSDKAHDLRESDETELAAFISEALKANTDVRLVNMQNNAYYMCGANMPSVGWAIITTVDKATADRPMEIMEQKYDEISQKAVTTYEGNFDASKRMIFVLLGIIVVLVMANAIFLSKRIVRPINRMCTSIKDLSGSNLQFKMREEYKTGDEVELLADTLANLSARTVRYISEITKITAEKERIGAELSVATQIQADMLPRIFPPYPERSEFDLYATMNPAREVGGDFYDFFLTDQDHLAIVMADVSGKGIPAAMFMVVAKTLIKNRAQMGGTPAQILHDVNIQLCEGNEAEFFVTVWLAIIELSTGKGVASNAGHEHPVLKKSSGKFEFVVYKHSVALAIMEDTVFEEHDFKLDPGDSLFVYTDGVCEATNSEDELFGSERLIEALNRKNFTTPKATLFNVSKEINEFVSNAEQFDDLTMLCMTYYGKENL